MSRHPEVLWAQRSSKSTPEKNIIYLTVNLPDIVESTLTYRLTSNTLSFKATGAESIKYEFDLEFFAEVDPEQSTSRLTSRSFVAVLRKKELKLEYWPRLTNEKLKTPFIKTDFGKWVDEDEQDGNPNFNDDFGVGGIPGMDDDMSSMGGMDFEKMMAQMGDSAGAGVGAEVGAKAEEPVESDSDEEGPPSLEDAEPAK